MSTAEISAWQTGVDVAEATGWRTYAQAAVEGLCILRASQDSIQAREHLGDQLWRWWAVEGYIDAMKEHQRQSWDKGSSGRGRRVDDQ